MAKINYTKTYFTTPGRISEEMYNGFKSQLKLNPNYEIDPNPTTFSEHFKGKLLTIAISIGLFLLGLLITADNKGDDSSIWNPVMGISILIAIISIIMLFLEGPSYATYVKEKKEYFSRMKYAIQNSNSYNEFISTFYR
ncbi:MULTISPECIES: hypothetical protein [unclassified Empedobacter]|uniref:hypothetical protein n=1 Tax=unclassified Empedobacter TaxID=2643773 RepID=UPI0025C337F3|nr:MULTISPECIES: hypothetical protein [unclassified Empedobacter]